MVLDKTSEIENVQHIDQDVHCTHLLAHIILMVTIGKIEANGVCKIEIDMISQTMSFPHLAQELLLLVLQ